jgi:hypothetical protein
MIGRVGPGDIAKFHGESGARTLGRCRRHRVCRSRVSNETDERSDVRPSSKSIVRVEPDCDVPGRSVKGFCAHVKGTRNGGWFSFPRRHEQHDVCDIFRAKFRVILHHRSSHDPLELLLP